jgi:hypothetical protein
MKLTCILGIIGSVLLIAFSAWKGTEAIAASDWMLTAIWTICVVVSIRNIAVFARVIGRMA